MVHPPRYATEAAAREALHQGRPAHGAGHYLRDIVYGANDGAVTTLAVIAGVAGASLSPLIALILGAANLVGDGISMAAANYLSLKSDLEQRGIPPSLERPLRHASATFAAFLLAGGLPLLAYFLPLPHPTARLAASALVALVAMAVVGAWRAGFIQQTRVRAAVEAMAIGGAAAGAAYLVGWLANLVASGA